MKWLVNVKGRAVMGVMVIIAICGSGLYAGENLPPFELAVVVALSGEAQDYGQAVLQGARLAADEINSQGGLLNHRLELVPLDNKSSALHAKEAAQKAVNRKVVGVVGAVWSTHSLAMAPVFQEHRIPMISPGSTAPKVTQMGNFIFRSCYTDEFQGRLMADFALHAMGRKRAAVLTNINETYSQILARYFASHFVLNGGVVVFEKGYKGSAIDFRDILDPLKKIEPDVVFIPGYSRDSGLIIRQAGSMGIETMFLGGDAWETAVSDFSGKAIDGSFFSTFWHPNRIQRRSKAFVHRFRSTFDDHEISAYTPLGYDAVWLFADAIKRSKSLNSIAIRDALASTKGYEGATGRFSFTADGDPIRKSASILQFKNGQWRFFKTYKPK